MTLPPCTGDGKGARTAALASAMLGPMLWAVPAVLLLEPHCRDAGACGAHQPAAPSSLPRRATSCCAPRHASAWALLTRPPRHAAPRMAAPHRPALTAHAPWSYLHLRVAAGPPPAPPRAVIAVFTSSQDPALLAMLRPLLRLVAAVRRTGTRPAPHAPHAPHEPCASRVGLSAGAQVNLFDGFQTILTGVVEVRGAFMGMARAAQDRPAAVQGADSRCAAPARLPYRVPASSCTAATPTSPSSTCWRYGPVMLANAPRPARLPHPPDAIQAPRTPLQVPLALWLGFNRGMGVLGMWTGMLLGSTLQVRARALLLPLLK
jgi:hypothetical protein